MGQSLFKDTCPRAKWTSLHYVFLCISKLTKGWPRKVGGPDLAHGPPVENPWPKTTTHEYNRTAKNAPLNVVHPTQYLKIEKPSSDISILSIAFMEIKISASISAKIDHFSQV